jgi:hypothetical protein
MFTSAVQYTPTNIDTHARTQTQAHKYATSLYLTGELPEINFVTFFIYYSYSYSGLFVPNRCRCRGLSLHLITLTNTHTQIDTHTHTVGLLWTREQTVVMASDITQHSTNAPEGIRTRNPSKQAAAYPRLRPRGHRNWPFLLGEGIFISSLSYTADHLQAGGLM